MAAVNFKLTFSKLDRKGDKIRSSQAIRDMWRVVNLAGGRVRGSDRGARDKRATFVTLRLFRPQDPRSRWFFDIYIQGK